MTTKEAKQKIVNAGKSWAAFLVFMEGQTVGGTPNNPDWYEDDVERFLQGKGVAD